MTDYAPLGAINSLKLLGSITGTATTTSEESIGSISVGAGTFKAGDKIIGIISGDPTGTAPALRIRLTSIESGIDVDLVPNVSGGVRNGFLYIAETSPIDNNEVIAFNIGVRNATSTGNTAGGNFITENWITARFTIEVRATGDSTSGSYTLKATFYRLEGA